MVTFLKNISSNRYLLYLVKFACIFSVFYFGTLLIIGLSSPENFYAPFIARYCDFITPLRYSILHTADYFLNLVSYQTDWANSYTFGIVGGQRVKMVYSCVGYGVMSFWGAFILANNGKTVQKLLWLIVGWVVLWCINVLRIVILLIILKDGNELQLPFDHHTLFNVAAYMAIFAMIFIYDRSNRQNPSKLLKTT